MPKLKCKSYLITNIPETDWKKFKRWTAMQDYNNLNDALTNLIRLAGNNDLKSTNSLLRREIVEQRT